ncbi:MAG: hypothetical protein FD147_1937 [Chloroflexi bacterium]|nr:MAG: hypothetical protein FD147_1937 [Chloroflexota bacterium]
MKLIAWILSFLFCYQLIACSPVPSQSGDFSTLSSKGTITQSANNSSPEIISTITPTQFPTPTLIPLTLIGTPQANGVETINEKNSFRLHEIARWGMGKFLRAVQSPNKQQIALLHTQGITFLSSNGFRLYPKFIPHSK